MNASKELCQELFELSGWRDTQLDYWYEGHGVEIPSYDLGYLLRELPKHLNHDEAIFELEMKLPFDDDWRFQYWSSGSRRGRLLSKDDFAGMIGVGNTPEDAACKLAIELFKQGILTKNTQQGSQEADASR